jgi:uncharacterized membrane protein YhhN
VDLFTVRYFPALLAALVAVFAVREYVTFREILHLKYVFTPMVTALLAGFVILSIMDGGGSAYRVLVLSALICSIIADTMLMVVEVDLMKQGIIFFMLAHVLYIAAFSLAYDYRPWNLAVAGILLMLLAVFYRGIRGSAGRMRIPIMVYAVVLCAMLFFALSCFNLEFTRREGLVVSGALLFVVSDFLLAYLTFIRPHRYESVIVWAVYAPGQFLIALSCFS